MTEQLTDLLVVEQVEAMEVFRQAREDGGWDDARDRLGELRAQTDAEAMDLLEPDDVAEYEKMRADEMTRWGRGGGRRGGRSEHGANDSEDRVGQR